jgi:hypothetical protein
MELVDVLPAAATEAEVIQAGGALDVRSMQAGSTRRIPNAVRPPTW